MWIDWLSAVFGHLTFPPQRRHVRTVFRASRKTVRTMQLLGFLISVCFFSDYLQVSTFSGGLCVRLAPKTLTFSSTMPLYSSRTRAAEFQQII
jgi:hypothetical protein